MAFPRCGTNGRVEWEPSRVDRRDHEKRLARVISEDGEGNPDRATCGGEFEKQSYPVYLHMVLVESSNHDHDVDGREKAAGRRCKGGGKVSEEERMRERTAVTDVKRER